MEPHRVADEDVQGPNRAPLCRSGASVTIIWPASMANRGAVGPTTALIRVELLRPIYRRSRTSEKARQPVAAALACCGPPLGAASTCPFPPLIPSRRPSLCHRIASKVEIVGRLRFHAVRQAKPSHAPRANEARQRLADCSRPPPVEVVRRSKTAIPTTLSEAAKRLSKRR